MTSCRLRESREGTRWRYRCVNTGCSVSLLYAKRKPGLQIPCNGLAPWITCPHRGPVLATVSARAAGCGCSASTVEVFRCERFTEPALLQSSPRCLEKIQAASPGYSGRTCRACDVWNPKSSPSPSLPSNLQGRFDATKHLAGFPYHQISRSIAAVTCHFNPHDSNARRKCFGLFSRQFPRIGLDLFTVEGSSNCRWDLPYGASNFRYDLDAQACLFAKENLLNLAIARLPDRFDRVLWIDSDVLLLPHDYADRLTDALDRHRVVQAFRELRYLGPNGEPETGWRPSLGWSNARAGTSSANHHAGGSYPGLAWAADRQLLADVGGLYDRVITGGGDVAWATACYGDESTPYMRYWSPRLIADIGRYRERVKPLVPSVGFADARGVHLYHGKLGSRQYVRRNEILTEVDFDPQRHLDYAPNGTLRWSANAPDALRRAVHAYMHGRREDE